jgi:hypothetical protein
MLRSGPILTQLKKWVYKHKNIHLGSTNYNPARFLNLVGIIKIIGIKSIIPTRFKPLQEKIIQINLLVLSLPITNQSYYLLS